MQENVHIVASMRGVSRALSVIRALNERGACTVLDLWEATRIPRPSIYRIVKTLSTLGYIVWRKEEGRYHLTHLVRTLSDGFNDEQWVRELALPVLISLQRETLWPTDLATFFDNAMYLRETTRRFSPFTIDRVTVGLRLPMLISATGRAYLAFCKDEERESIFENLARSSIPQDAIVHDRRMVRKIIAETRRNGYGQQFREVFTETGGISIPIMSDQHVFACLNLTFIASALTPQQAAAKYLGMMQRAAGRIEAGLRTAGAG